MFGQHITCNSQDRPNSIGSHFNNQFNWANISQQFNWNEQSPLDVTPLHPSHTSESQWHIQSAKLELGEAIEGHSEEFFFLTFQLVKFTFVSCLICGLSTFPPKIHSSRAHCCHEGQRSPFLTQQCDAFHFIFLLFCLQCSPTSEKLQELCFLLLCVN